MQGMQTSPVQRLMSRRTKTLVPIATSLLHPEVQDGVMTKIELKRQKAKSHYDKNTKILPDLHIGQEVRVSPTQRGKPWDTAICREKLSDRSYMVETNGESLRRNREALNPEQPKPEQPAKETSQPTPDQLPQPTEAVLRRSQRVIKKPDLFV
ncbi:uncharacterized protein LOC114575454 [Exaiptasia diaphana]|uniref:Uncharacterized protein n=1 Tax=Exaiptasia diaphana TaxID=2652724 RepID=A0A913YL10_EXADI|nr:uncharacterized protein LOC114575454 [Exaiptasia diaphana]